MELNKIRNFSIIAHIDHGKSTLSDRVIEITNAVSKREMQDQLLDSMDLERERGITIKLNAVELYYHHNNADYTFHLIDTPGHVDFTYEVSRSLAACDGVILVVDATQGVEAQTLANFHLAIENNLPIIPVINKIDLPSADIETTKKQICNIFNKQIDDIVCISAKTGLNVPQLLDKVITDIGAPTGSSEQPLQALIFDSYFDQFKGVVCLVCIKNGKLKVGDKIKMMSSNKTFTISELGIRTPKIINKKELACGQVGWFSASIRTAKDISVGDTVTLANAPAPAPLPGYKKILPTIFSGIYPIDTSKFDALKEAMQKISLSDSSLIYEYETSQALGYGLRCGFLGLLHMDIIQERIAREYQIEVLLTSPSVKYQVTTTDNKTTMVDNPSHLPDRTKIRSIAEPYINLIINTPETYLGEVMKLCQSARGEYVATDYIEYVGYKVSFHIPLSEVIFGFFDKLKSVSRGYATMNYEFSDYKINHLVKVDLLLNGTKVDALSFICHQDFAYSKANFICSRLKDLIPRQQFEIPIQAVIGGKVISRETIKAMYKNVLAKCYGGDVSRKKKLLEQQKEGKKKLKSIGNVEIPHDVFVKLLAGD